MTMMCNMKVGDIVSVEDGFAGSYVTYVGKLANISSSKIQVATVQIGVQKFKRVNLSKCWNATHTQKKEFFKAMLK